MIPSADKDTKQPNHPNKSSKDATSSSVVDLSGVEEGSEVPLATGASHLLSVHVNQAPPQAATPTAQSMLRGMYMTINVYTIIRAIRVVKVIGLDCQLYHAQRYVYVHISDLTKIISSFSHSFFFEIDVMNDA